MPASLAGDFGYVLDTFRPFGSGLTVMPTPENCPFVESLNFL